MSFLRLAPMLLLVFEEFMPAPLAANIALEPARCDANLAMTFEREIRGFFAGATLPPRVDTTSGFSSAGSRADDVAISSTCFKGLLNIPIGWGETAVLAFISTGPFVL